MPVSRDVMSQARGCVTDERTELGSAKMDELISRDKDI
jgi:hypothetical protein